MTTLRRDLRQKILELILESSMFSGASARWEEYDLMDKKACKKEAGEFADQVADAVLEIVNKKEAPTKDPMWNFLHGIDITQDEIEDNKTAEEAKQSFEMHMKFNPLPWSSTQSWTKFEKFVVEQFKKDKLIFAKYKTWQQGDGKFVALSNRKIKERPDDFIACFPDFLAISSMYSEPKPIQPKLIEDDNNDAPLTY